MNINKLLTIFILAVFSATIFAYGGGSSSKKACKKPEFTQFTPAHLSVVAPASEFSFLASGTTDSKSIVVSVKKLPVDVTISKKSGGYSVSGKLPDTLKGTYARVGIKAKGTNNCKGNDGWLLKIEDN